MKNVVEKLPHYETIRHIKIESNRVAIIYNTLVILLVGYSLFDFYLSGEYLEKHALKGTTTVQLIGSGYTNSVYSNKKYKKIQDAIDLRHPSVEVDAISIITSVDTITSQKRIDSDDQKPMKCSSAQSCEIEGDCNVARNVFGLLTSKCKEDKTCEIEGWCPFFFKNKEVIEKIDESVYLKIQTNSFFKGNEKQNNEFSISLKEIISLAGENYDEIKDTGSLFLFRFVYNCDFNNRSACAPKFEVKRLDNQEKNTKTGFTLYRANYTKPKDAIEDKKRVYYRDITKMTAIRIVFVIDGTINTFSLSKTILGLGSAFGLVGLASSIIDFLIDNFLEEGKKYGKKIVVDIEEENLEIEKLCETLIKKKFTELGIHVSKKEIKSIDNEESAQDAELLKSNIDMDW